MEKRYYVYVYLDPRKIGKYVYGDYKFLHEPIYVGKGKRKRAYYVEKHNSFLKAKLAKIGKPIILLLAEQLLETNAFSLEKELIALIGRHDLGKGSLCNFTNGGEGPSGASRSEETKRKISKSMNGMIRPIETRNKMSAYRTGKTLSQKSKDKISVKNKIAWENLRKAVSSKRKENLNEKSNAWISDL